MTLGVFQIMKQVPPSVLWEIIGVIYGASMAVSLFIVLVAPRVGTTIVRPRKPLVMGQEYRLQNLQPSP